MWDAGEGACPGFYARHRGGKASRWRFGLFYRLGGKARYHSVAEDGGAIPPEVAERLGLERGAAWSPEAARLEAERVRGLVRDGHDPDAERGMPTFRELAERFMREHMAEPLRKARTVEEYRGLLDRHLLPEFGDKRLDKLDQAAVTRFARGRKDKPITANRAVAVLSSIYSRAGAWGVVPAGVNPARGVPRFREVRRERFLSVEELQRLGAALRELEHESRRDTVRGVSPFALAAIRVLLFTGARPSEIIGLKWEHVDVERGALRLPDSKTGAKVIHLSQPAQKILAGLPRVQGDPRVFPPHKKAASEADLESAWRRVRKRAGLEDVRLYDACRPRRLLGSAALDARPKARRCSGGRVQERTLIPDAEREARRAAERQFWGFIELEDEPGYWAWVSLQPGFDPESLLARRRAAEAWREGLAEWRAMRRRP